MKSETLLLLLSLVYFASCSFKEPKSQDSSSIIQINLSSLEEIDPLMNNNGFKNKYRLLKLETKAECLIKWIEKIIIDKKHIFVKDSNDKLFVFDADTGKYLNSIGEIGSGPNELLSFIDFYIDKKGKSVFIYDSSKSKMFKFSYQGNLLHVEKCKNKVLSDYFSNFLYTQNKELILTMFNSNSTKHNFRVINTDKYSLKNDYLPYMVTGVSNLTFKNPKVAINDKYCYAISYLSDTIYQYSTDGNFYPKYIFNSGLQHINNKSIKIGTSFEIAIEAETILKKKGVSTGISQLYTTDNLLYFPYYIETNEYNIYWNIQKQKGYYTKNYFSTDPIRSMDNLITTTNDAFVRIIHSEDIINSLNEYEYEDSITRHVIRQTKNEDNPILIFHYTNERQ